MNDSIRSNLASTALNASINALPILKMANQVSDQELRKRLKSQWECLILTAAFMAAVAVAFLSTNAKEDHNDEVLREIFITLNAASFLALIVAVAQCTCFLTTLMMCPPGKAHQALHELRFLEPIPSLLLIFAILAFIASVPIFMLLQFGNAASSLTVHIITGILGALGIMLFVLNMRVQRKLFDSNDEEYPSGYQQQSQHEQFQAQVRRNQKEMEVKDAESPSNANEATNSSDSSMSMGFF